MTTYFDVLIAAFPNIPALDTEFYDTEPYKSNVLRRCKIVVFLGALSNFEDFLKLSPSQQNALAKKIETGCVNSTIKKAKEDNITCSWQTETFVRRYNNTVHEKAHELDFTSNTFLVPRVVSGMINPYHVGNMSPEEVNPEHNLRLKEKSDARKNQKIQKKIVTCYTCPECQAKESTVQNLQLRGLDEAKSTVVTCENCDHQWTEEK